MSKIDKSERYKSLDVMLPQGARSRHKKAVEALEKADDLIPTDALGGNSMELREAIKNLNTCAENLTEMMVYRKIMGVD